MDSIVDYLIVLFFIITFLSSVFKKKKKQLAKADNAQLRPVAEVERQNIQKDNVVAQKSNSAAKSSFENILKAMLQVPEPVEGQKSEVDAYYEEAMRKSEILKTKKEPLIPASEELHRKDKTIEKSNTYADAMREVKKKHTSQKAMKIKSNLSNLNTIKDYIVMNEILGKPIALRE